MSAGLCEVIGFFIEEIADSSSPNIQDLLQCDESAFDALAKGAQALNSHARIQADDRSFLAQILKRSHAKMSLGQVDTRRWRRLYTDASVMIACADVYDFSSSRVAERALSAIATLDHAIVIAGAPGEGRLDFILDLIDAIQADCLDSLPAALRSEGSFAAPSTSIPIDSMDPILPSATHPVPRISSPPSLSAFISRYSQRPFVIPGFLSDWPALNEHPWASLDYLRAVAGPGRVVPVEVGSDYRSDDWTQKMMPWGEFLSSLDPASKGPPAEATSTSVLYLAQHSLFTQFPALRHDIFVPDYVYSDLDPPAGYPHYVPPANDDRLVINAWLGPKGTNSPAHTDPFFNFFGQVVGRKTLWLAPPEVFPYIYCYAGGANTPLCSEDAGPRNPAANNESPTMSNTSRVDVLVSSPEDTAASKAVYPDFWIHAVPAAMSVTLNPGDLLFFPPGWWHAARSEETSFSVSMWF